MRALTILIADDEAVVRNVILAILARDSHQVFEADSAAEALEISNEFKGIIDLLIADHALKTMSGREVAETMSRVRPGLKVLQISSYPLSRLQEENGVFPGAGFLAKPFKADDLRGKVGEMCAGRNQAHGKG